MKLILDKSIKKHQDFSNLIVIQLLLIQYQVIYTNFEHYFIEFLK